jgi:membrane-associated protein
MEQILDAFLALDGVAVYVVVGLLAFGEAAAFVGLLLPGEVAVLLGGLLASQGRVSLPVLLCVVAAAAIAGDSAGYEIGRRWGSRLLSTHVAQRHAGAVCDVMGQLQRHAGAAVFVGRWTSVLRAVVPAVAGMSRMPYGRFLAFNVLGGVAWAAVFTLAGYAARESYRTVEAATGRGGWVVAAVVAGWLSVRLVRRRHEGSRDDRNEHPSPAAASSVDGERFADPAAADPGPIAADVGSGATMQRSQWRPRRSYSAQPPHAQRRHVTS